MRHAFLPEPPQDGIGLVVDLANDRAVRIAAKESSKALAKQMHPEIENKNKQQMLAYRELPDEELFSEKWVSVRIEPKEFPGYKGERIACAECGEGISYERFVERDGCILCLACADPNARYYQPLESGTNSVSVPVTISGPRCECP